MKTLSSIAFLACATLFAGGLVTLPVLTERPVLDGRIDAKGEYRYAVSITNFLRADRIVHAAFRTRAWMGYDSKNLYLAFEMEDSRLLHASNARGSFKEKLEGPSQRVWEDECMEIRLLPPWVKNAAGFSHFYFAFTPKGATCSAAPEGYDGKFELKVKSATSHGDGFWYAETAIPFPALGMPEDFRLENSAWRFNLTRFDSINGCSTWNDLPDGNHNAIGNFGVLRFGGQNTPALKIPDFSQTGIEEFDVATENRGRSLPCSSWNESYPANERPNYHGIADASMIPEGSGSFHVSSTRLTAAEDFIWRWNYTRRTPPAAIYLNPFVRLNKGASLNLKGADAAIFNNRPLKQADKSISIVPSHGVNSLVFDSDGTAVLLSKSHFPLPEHLGSVFPKGRHSVTFLNSVSELDIPGADKMHLKLSDGQAYKLQWWAGGIYKFLLQDSIERISLNFILPDGMEIVAAANDERHPDGFPFYRMAPHTKLYNIERHPCKSNGRSFTRFEIWTDKFRLVGDENPVYFPYRTECFILVRAERRITGHKSAIAYYVQVKDKNGVHCEIPRPLAVTVLPKIEGVQTGKIAAYYKTTGIKDDVFAERAFSFLQDVGIDRVFSLMCNNPASQRHNVAGIAFGQLENTDVEPDRIALGDMFRQYPQSKCNLMGGKYPNIVYLNRNTEPWKLIDKAVAELRSRNPLLKDFIWDYEFQPFSRYADTSADTMRIFAEAYNIPENPTQEIVQRKYMKEWIDFRCRELGTFSAKLKRVLNSHGFSFGFYCGPPADWVRERYSIDARYLSCDEFQIGGTVEGGQNETMLGLARQNNARLTYCLHLCSIDRTGTGRGTMLRRSMLSRNGGLLLWYELGIDAEDATEIAAFSRIIRDYGHFLESGEAFAIQPKGNRIEMAYVNRSDAKFADRMLNDNTCKTVSMVVYRKDGKFAAPVINETKNPLKLEITFPEADGDVMEAFSGTAVSNGGTFAADVPAEGALFFVGKSK